MNSIMPDKGENGETLGQMGYGYADSPQAPDVVAVAIREKFSELSPNQRSAARYMLENLPTLGFLSATQLGDRLGLNPGTIVRLCQRLGFRGYPDLQGHVRRSLTVYPSYRTFIDRIHESQALAGPYLIDAVAKTRGNLDKMMATMSPQAFDTFVQKLLDAGRIYLIGGGVARPVVSYLASSIRMGGFDVLESAYEDTEVAQQLASLRSSDTLVAVGFQRYLKHTVNALEAAQQVGAVRMAITDNDLSPLATGAEVVLCTPGTGVSLRSSIAPALVLCEAILAALGSKSKARMENALKSVDEEYGRAGLFADIQRSRG